MNNQQNKIPPSRQQTRQTNKNKQSSHHHHTSRRQNKNVVPPSADKPSADRQYKQIKYLKRKHSEYIIERYTIFSIDPPIYLGLAQG